MPCSRSTSKFNMYLNKRSVSILECNPRCICNVETEYWIETCKCWVCYNCPNIYVYSCNALSATILCHGNGFICVNKAFTSRHTILKIYLTYFEHLFL